jgi:hypothetical protein
MSGRLRGAGTITLAPAFREDFDDGLDMSYLFCDLDLVNLKLGRDYAAQAYNRL